MNKFPSITLVIGGARSGKSRYAESLVSPPERGLYLATAEAGDAEMLERIKRHQSRRGKNWDLIEEPFDVAGVITREASPERPILVDCLTFWLSNLMISEENYLNELPRIIASAQSANGKIIFVTNEVGLSVVPENSLARSFRDAAGIVNQSIAQIAHTVVFMVAGIPNIIKEKKD